jgi:tetratricopeptide (TPR) repeat protein
LKRKRFTVLFTLAVLSALTVLVGCSTKKNTFSRRAFHNVTSHYNVYWNGNEGLNTGVTELRKIVVDDYSKVLLVNNYGKKSDAQKQNTNNDRAIQKSAITIQRHSMVFGGKERVKWIKDAYLLMGKAHFYKQDYTSARRTFDFVNKQYGPDEIAFTAQMWLANTYVQTKQYEKAEPLFQSLFSMAKEIEMPTEVTRNLHFFYADFMIKTEKFDKAASSLKQGLLDNNNRMLKTRAMYALAQIYQKQNDLSRALEMYKMVIKRNPPYEMAFAARISLATAYDASQGDSKQIVKVLNKMLRDEKNKDYLDKIYYALADIALKEGDEPLGITHLKKSVSTTVNDKNQQTTSALRLAAILFDNNEYIVAQAYYDTAVRVLQKDYPGYDSIKSKAEVLNDLVLNLSTVQLQDSLVRLAEMDSGSRNMVIGKLVTAYVEGERAKAEKEASDARNNVLQRNNTSTPAGGTSNSADWYFYNPNTLSFGFTEFVKKWGRRRLEDNWRISDKQSITASESEGFLAAGENKGTEQDSAAASLTPRDPEYYLQDIPFKEEEKTAALESVMESLNNLGYIYKEQLRDYPRSKESYQTLNDRFPDNKYRLQAMYAMYKMYVSEDDTAKAESFRNQILKQYPDSDYAKVLLDPQYFVKKAALDDESGAFYEQTLDAYNEEQFYRVMMNADRARIMYAADTMLMPRFEFLRAVAAGRLQTIDSLAAGLDRIVKTYPKSPVADRAIEILRSVNKEYNLNIELPPEPGDTIQQKIEEFPYTFDAASGHLVMIVTNSKNVRTDPLKVRISDFNERNFKLNKLIIRSLVLDNERTLITIGNFDDLEASNDYFGALAGNEYVFGSLDMAEIIILPVSLTNYPVFYRSKDVEQYKRFWEKNTQKTE